ncbi:hypothetical protein IV81_GL001167 [Pediococcus stilesii]|uniref:Uncharacterized protein n=1 Tax=Pediococcus stilesii TaxID=331679 RepID=A0A0R2KSJ2_9LACO|nr:hypothetical protein IV81_GL001167 [Pediococcus stilesii]
MEGSFFVEKFLLRRTISNSDQKKTDQRSFFRDYWTSSEARVLENGSVVLLAYS